MNCDARNRLIARGEIDRDDLWPKINEYEGRRFQFRWEFGLESLPQEPGVLTIRGPRQYGKSTWMEIQLLDTLEEFGNASGFILNGDEIYSHQEFESKLIELEASFSKKAPVKRIFIDEITSIASWEKVIKRLIDSGRLKDVLIITTGSNAADLRRGSEKLPGRKGRLKRTEYVFLPISYKEYLYQTREEIGQFKSDSFWGYVLTGGSPLAVNELAYDDLIHENFIALTKDWILGDIVGSGRTRIFVLNLLRRIYEHGAGTISYTKLAREAGLANNSAALDYVERLSDLYCLMPCMQWDAEKDLLLVRKPSKIHFINLAAAVAFHPDNPKYIHEIRELEGRKKAMIHEWIVAQELWRRYNLKNQKENRVHGPIEDFAYWASKDHEIDFVTPDREFFEVKAGPASALDFAWFSKTFPGHQLHVICDTTFEAEAVKGITLQDFLLGAESDLYYDEDKYQFKSG